MFSGGEWSRSGIIHPCITTFFSQIQKHNTLLLYPFSSLLFNSFGYWSSYTIWQWCITSQWNLTISKNDSLFLLVFPFWKKYLMMDNQAWAWFLDLLFSLKLRLLERAVFLFYSCHFSNSIVTSMIIIQAIIWSTFCSKHQTLTGLCSSWKI